jgi:hypothetical protein
MGMIGLVQQYQCEGDEQGSQQKRAHTSVLPKIVVEF